MTHEMRVAIVNCGLVILYVLLRALVIILPLLHLLLSKYGCNKIKYVNQIAKIFSLTYLAFNISVFFHLISPAFLMSRPIDLASISTSVGFIMLIFSAVIGPSYGLFSMYFSIWNTVLQKGKKWGYILASCMARIIHVPIFALFMSQLLDM